MIDLDDTDIRLDDNWQLTRAANGDAPLCSGLEAIYQNIVIEAVTQQGDLFYDPSFGWSLYDFIQSEDDELTRLEMIQRARVGLSKRENVLPESVMVEVTHSDNGFRLGCSFRFSEEEEQRQLNIVIDAVNVEVISSD